MLLMQYFWIHVSKYYRRDRASEGTYAAIWEVVEGCKVLGDGETGEKHGGYERGLHFRCVLDC